MKKHIILGVLGIILSIVVFYLLITFKQGLNRYLSYFLILIAGANLVGSFVYIFTDYSVYLHTAIYVGLMFLFIIISDILPSPFKGIFITVMVLLFICVPIIKEYLCTRSKSSSRIGKFIEKKKAKEEKAYEKMEKEYKKILASIDFGKKSIFLRFQFGNTFQCIKGRNKYYFVHIGSESFGISLDKLIKDFTNEDDFIKDKKDFAIDKKDIIKIKYNEKNVPNTSFPNSGIVKIYLKNNNRKFIIIDNVSSEDIKLFFQDLDINIKYDKANKKEIFTEVENKRDKKSFENIKLANLILTIISVILAISFLFININYKIQSIACMLLFIATFSFYIKYNDVVSMADKGEKKDKINVILPMYGTAIVLGLRSLMDFNIMSYKMLIIMSLFIFFIIMFIFFVFSKEYKKEKSCILGVMFAVLIFAPSAALQVNYDFEKSALNVEYSTVSNMEISTGSKAPDTYRITVINAFGNKMELNISKNYYRSIKIGDTIPVFEKEGFLKIPYAYTY